MNLTTSGAPIMLFERHRRDVHGAYLGGPPTLSTTPKNYHHGDLRRALLETARAALREQGVDSLSLRDLARRLGVTSRAPYRHFASKEALTAALAATGFRELRAALEIAASDAAGQQLLLKSLAYVRFALAEPALFRLMFSYRISDAGPELLAEKMATKTLLVGSAAADARVGEDISARALGSWSLVHGLAILILDGLAMEEGILDEGTIRRVLAAILYR